MVWEFLTLGKYYGLDSLLELLSILVSGVISYYSYRIYKIVNDKNFKYFSIAFLLIAVSFLFKIFSNLTLLHQTKITTHNFVFVVTNFFSFILYKIFYLSGFIVLFLIAVGIRKREGFLLPVYLGLITVLFSIYFNFIFYLTITFILAYLATHFYKNYERVRTLNSILVFLGFLFIFLGNLIFVFIDVSSLSYPIGEALTFLGFLVLLINQIKIKSSKTLSILSKFESGTIRAEHK